MSDFLFLYWDDVSPETKFMKAKEIIERREDLLKGLIKHIGSKLRISKDYRGDLNVDTCYINGGEYLSIKLDYNNFLTDNQRDTINSLFPQEVDGIEFRLMNIWDYDYDDERSWNPSIGLTCDILKP